MKVWVDNRWAHLFITEMWVRGPELIMYTEGLRGPAIDGKKGSPLMQLCKSSR